MTWLHLQQLTNQNKDTLTLTMQNTTYSVYSHNFFKLDQLTTKSYYMDMHQ